MKFTYICELFYKACETMVLGHNESSTVITKVGCQASVNTGMPLGSRHN
jgi:hypothetical protein